MKRETSKIKSNLYYKFLLGLSLIVATTLVTKAQDIYLEAECGLVGSNWQINSNASASEGEYVEINSGLNQYSPAPTGSANRISYQFDLTNGGNYKVFGRVIANNTGNDSYWIRVNEGTWYRWNDIAPSTSWTWDQVHDSDNGNAALSWNLLAGKNTLDIAYREDGTWLDKLFITTSSTAPTGLGEPATGCIDTDGDGIMNQFDLDDDNDGIYDVHEKQAVTGEDDGCELTTRLDLSMTPTLESGSALSKGAVYRFAGAATDVDVLLTIEEMVNTSIPTLDENATDARSFQPRTGFNSTNIGDESYTQYKFGFVEAGTNTPTVLSRLCINFADIDGNTSYGEQNWAANVRSYRYNDPTDLTFSDHEDSLFWIKATADTIEFAGSDTIQDSVNFSAIYIDVSEVHFRLGCIAYNPNLSVSVRAHRLDFTCVLQYDNAVEMLEDYDGDGLPNSMDLDADGDGCNDVLEAGFSDYENDGLLGIAPYTVDSAGRVVGASNGYSVPHFSFLLASDGSACGFGASPLPIILTEFEAEPKGAIVELFWETELEINNDYFDVQRSNDMIDWTTIRTVAGAGNSTDTRTYRTEDDNPFLGTSYYRLKQVDYDGEYEYSSIQSVYFEDHGIINVFPNPTRDFFMITNSNELEMEVELWNNIGQLVRSGVIASNSKMDVSDLPSGAYYLSVKRGNEVTTSVLMISEK